MSSQDLKTIVSLLKNAYSNGAFNLRLSPAGLKVETNNLIELFDDFFYLGLTGNPWTRVTDGDTGTPVQNTSLPGGWLELPTAAVDNDYSYIHGGLQFRFLTDKALYFESSFRLLIS